MTVQEMIKEAAMTREKSAVPIRVVRKEFDSRLTLDALVGLPAAGLLRASDSPGSRPIEVTMRANFDGTEHGGSHGGLAYRDTVMLDAHRVRDGSRMVRRVGTHVEDDFPTESMTFTGGEVGIEEFLAGNSLLRRIPKATGMRPDRTPRSTPGHRRPGLPLLAWCPQYP